MNAPLTATVSVPARPYTTTSYDALGRPIDIERPVDSNNPALQHTTFAYLGLTTTTTDAEGKTAKTIRDAMDRTFRSVDHAGYYQQFNYDAFGSVRRVLDSLGANLMLATYAYGVDAFRLTSNDMDLGAWSYTPNALGEVVGHSDAKGQSFTASFDKLSRPLTRVEPGNTTAWTWGTSSAAHNIGRLASVSATGHSESYSYDNKGRLSQRSTVADATYLTNFAYDSTSGQLDSLQYPTSTSGYRLKLKYTYQYGILQKVSDFAVPSTVFWQANAADARGNILDQLLGNGLKTLRGYDEVTGMPQSIQSGPGGGSSRQNMSFQWNKVGSLKQRKDLNRTLTEDFYNDNLHRLDYSRLNAVQNLDVGYDARGNITSKSDVGGGTWTYHASKKHAVISAGSNSFSYDANGNQITRNSDDITWTSYNYPSRIDNGARYHDYYYDAHRQRWKQVYFNGSSSETTIFVGGILEKRTAAGITEYRHAIKVGRQPVALYTRPTSGSVTTEYFLLDHLGSVAEVTSSSGAVVVSESFSAFGGRRDPTDWSGGLSAGDEALIAGITPRGYTFHTNLESSSLIHMNGRVMDSLTGRFLSADPYVAEPYLTQGFNRYSYVNNNPLTFTDPSGFCADPSGASAFFCATAFASALSYAIDGLFGRSNVKRPPPDYCFIAGPEACLTSAASLSQPISSDVYGHPGRVESGSQTDAQINDGMSLRVGGDIDDLIAPVRGMAVGRGPNGRRLSEMLIRQMSGAALIKLRQARRTGTGRGSTIGAAVFQNGDGLIVSVPNVAGADGLVSQGGGAIGRTSAASAGASAVFILLPDRVDSSPVGRGAPQFVRQAINASSVDAAGLPVIVVGPRGMPRTGLLFEAIIGHDSDIIGVVDEVPIR